MLDQVEIHHVVAEALNGGRDLLGPIGLGATRHDSSDVTIQALTTVRCIEFLGMCFMSSTSPSRKPYDSPQRADAARRTRAAVVSAFGEMLFADGYRATTIRAVADRAGVSAETIYKTFGGKEGLIKALWDTTLAGDDEPVAMADRERAREMLATEDPTTKVWLYAGAARGVHERLAPLATLLAQAGPDATAVLATGEQERRISVRTFVDHLAECGALRAGTDPMRAADACWALTATSLFTKLTAEAGWDGATYQQWLTEMLTANLL
jgi:AcrR family transcriptional regulator